MDLLDFENQMYLELFHDDALVVLAKGIGIERLAINLIKTFNDPGNLVFVIGSTPIEEEYIINKLQESGVSLLPKRITSDVSVKDRRDVYMDGGILFVSSTILVVDMLVDRVPIDLITGMIVFRAHKILESCQEAFIIRLYRMKNSKGFIKAISSNAAAFTRGFSQIQRVMRNLFVKNLFLWPRFHAVVASSIERAKPEVLEIHVPMTNAMTSIQIAILDLMNVCVKELKHINPSLDTDELTVENAIAKSFDKIIKYQLDPVWHQLNSKTKRLLSDLKFLRSILQSLTQQDCVTFYKMLKAIKDNVSIGTQMSDWLFLDASDSLFLYAKERVFGSAKKKDQIKDIKKLSFEENAKWKALCNILTEISQENKNDENQMVIIIVNDYIISKQLKNILSNGSQEYLFNVFLKLFPNLSSELKGNHKAQKRKLKEDEQTLTQMIHGDTENTSDNSSDNFLKFENLNIEFYPIRHSAENHFKFQNICELHHPKYLIFYDGDMELIRRIELYQALNPHDKLKLVKINSRKAGGQIRQLEDQKVIVDMREFRSELPSLIHRRGIEVIPVTLEVGDYVLTPDMVVERKSSTGKYYFNSSASSQNIVSKLILLTTHFPELRILWCPSPYATAEMFELLKLKRDQPDEKQHPY
ncbi:DNA repair endonuclease XPF [Caerostris extrusa]|uniref:DNA repair endonuclease XPF n=1 Tax=Caerostris extrusa TaxID=172846 RepID=A0AAV4Q6K5_CAEEX|nr:DNA repair endonuclease XPF [Caerostris extrusa]